MNNHLEGAPDEGPVLAARKDGATKAGVIQLGKHLGDTLAWEGIHVNTISPGDFPTDLNTTARDHTDEMKRVIPGMRIGEKENIAGAAIFLASRAGTAAASGVIAAGTSGLWRRP
jgi:NAD(P)-dependent dehydrogenase (short-subunit alcohol dehydrogenase family)